MPYPQVTPPCYNVCRKLMLLNSLKFCKSGFIAIVCLIKFTYVQNQLHLAKPILLKGIELSQQAPYWHCRLLFQLAVRFDPHLYKICYQIILWIFQRFFHCVCKERNKLQYVNSLQLYDIMCYPLCSHMCHSIYNMSCLCHVIHSTLSYSLSYSLMCSSHKKIIQHWNDQKYT